MNTENQCHCAEACNSEPAKRGIVVLHLMVRRWVWEQILSLYRRRLYRHVMRLAHRYNWHYAPPNNIPEPNHNGLKVNNHWCQWCGLRGHTWEYDKNAPLSPNKQI